jgi:hypothetical protein
LYGTLPYIANRLCPPLVVTKEEADVAMDVLEECIPQVGK